MHGEVQRPASSRGSLPRLHKDVQLDLTQAAVPPRAFDLLLNPSLKKLISQRFAKDRHLTAFFFLDHTQTSMLADENAFMRASSSSPRHRAIARPARLYADGEETLDLTQAAVPPRAFDLLLNPSLKLNPSP
jgi:hypothetical protein